MSDPRAGREVCAYCPKLCRHACPAAEAERNAQIIADLTQAEAIVYLDMIESGQMTPQSAWAAHREDTRKEREQAERDRQVLRDRYTSMAQCILTASS